MPTGPDVTLCMLVKNEAHRLRACLDSVRHLAGELIVVDTGSNDETAAVAAACGARVISFDFTRVDFSAARNCALERSQGRWIVVLDADETLEADGVGQFESIVAGDTDAGYFFERHNGGSGATETTVDYVVRLFPNRPVYRYRGRVHETIDASILAAGGRLIKSSIRLQHKFAGDGESRRRKNHWYIQILKEEIEADPTDTSRLDFLAAEYHQLAMFNEATAIAEEIAKLRPNDAQAHLFAGTYHLLFKPDLKQARRDFKRALEIRPNYPEAESFLNLLNEREAVSGGWRAE